MPPKKKIVKKIIVRKVRKPVVTPSTADVLPVSIPAVVEKDPLAHVDGSTVASLEGEPPVTEPKELKADAMPMEAEEPSAEVADAASAEAEDVPSETAGAAREVPVDAAGSVLTEAKKTGKRMVKKVRKVKKVVVRRIPKVKEPAKVAVEEVPEESVKGVESVVVEPETDLTREMSARRKRRMTEIFIGGLERSAKEEDVRKVFGEVGEIVEVRMMMDPNSKMNKGYAFLQYATAAQAKQAVRQFKKVEVCGKRCGASAIEGNDTIFIGNIDKKWKKEDVIKLLKDTGIEKIDTVTIVPDPNNANLNRGYAFLELETNRDAQNAYKKLQMKDAFGVHTNIKVSWAAPRSEPDEEEMQKVKSVFIDGVPSTWSEETIRNCFGKFGEIVKVVLSRNISTAKRKDFAFVNYTSREAALSCIKSFDEGTSGDESKAGIKVCLAKPVLKTKQNKGTLKAVIKEIPKERTKAAENFVKTNASTIGGQPVKRLYGSAVSEGKSSTTAELLQVLREQASWNNSKPGYPYTGGSHAEKRPYSSLGEPTSFSDPRSSTRARLDAPYHSVSSLPSTSILSAPQSYFQRANAEFGAGGSYTRNSATTLQGGYTGNLYAGSQYSRY